MHDKVIFSRATFDAMLAGMDMSQQDYQYAWDVFEKRLALQPNDNHDGEPRG